MESFAPSSHRILVVDDTAANRRLYGALLKRSGYFVTTASSGKEALSEIAHQKPSLVLLDYMMPEMDGIEVLKQLRKGGETKNIPVVMLTASTEPDHIDRALAEGANDYITKPVNGKLLITRLKAMIRASAARQNATVKRRTDALIADLQEAARVQQSQLPNVPFEWRDYKITGAVAPSGEVGGDLFDIVSVKGRCIAFLLDVAGHGTASALVAAETRAEFRHLLARSELSAAISRLNQHLARRATGKYCCLAAVELDGDEVSIVNAGLPPVAVLRGSKAVHQVWGSGMPIGMFEDSEYVATSVEVMTGDRLVLLSDGLTEPFGETDDAISAVERLGLWPSVSDDDPDGETLRKRIRIVTRDSAPELQDDATVLIVRRSSSVRERLSLPARPDVIPGAVKWALELAPPWVDRDAVDHGLTEALTNAIMHGALGVGSEMREAGGYDRYLALAEELPKRPDFTNTFVQLHVVQNPETFAVRIEWQGTPCPASIREIHQAHGSSPRARPLNAVSLQSSGMGLRIITSLFDRVRWDSDGLGMDLWLQRSMVGRDRTTPPPPF